MEYPIVIKNNFIEKNGVIIAFNYIILKTDSIIKKMPNQLRNWPGKPRVLKKGRIAGLP